MGAAAALGAAALWAITNLLLRAEVVKLGGATANAWRTAVSTVVFAPLFLVAREPRDLFGIPPATLATLLGSVLLSMVIGDILQFTAIRRLGIALAMPIASCYPLFTLLIAAAFLGELLTARAAGGVLLVMVGVTLVAVPPKSLDEAERPRRRERSADHWAGVGIALASAICAAGATTLTRLAVRDLDVLAANALRLPFSAAICFLISTAQRRQPPWRIERRQFVPLVLAGVVSLGSGLLFLTAVQRAGAAKTATLTAAASLFGLLGAVIFLGERPSPRNVVGTVVAFCGIVLVV